MNVKKLLALIAAAAVGAGATAGTLAAVGGSSASPAQTVAAATPAALETALSAAQIYARDAAGVVDVTVTTTATDPFGGSRTTRGEGSGFVLDGKGDIVTNEHVVADATAITVTFEDGTKARATLVGSDASSDLAVIRVHVRASTLKPLRFGDSGAVQVGESVVAVGSPFGYPETITSGIVSALGREIESPSGATIAGAIQTDAAINPGNSGEPLIDATGAVVGVNAQIDSASSGSDGVGFAIPSNTVKSVVAKILAGTL